jgi:heme/copper-type cytochrome/quinol oxidase subunit 4
MRNTAIMNGALIGFGLGFILASIALYRLVADYVPQYANTWYFQGIAIVGGAGLVVGIIFEIIERVKARNKPEETEEME